MTRGILITARLGSSRLPRKHLLDLQGMKCIEHVMERAKRSRFADKIILCTTALKEDEELCDLAIDHNILVHLGSVEDKIDRWNRACIEHKIEEFATFDADDLLCDPALIDLGFDQLQYTDADYIQWNENTMICGCFTYVIRRGALQRVWSEKKTHKTEMAFDFFEKSNWCKREFLDLNYVRRAKSYMRPEIRLTLDYMEDYYFFFELFQQFGRNIINMFLPEIVDFIDTDKGILAINSFRHEEWKKNQERIINEGQI